MTYFDDDGNEAISKMDNLITALADPVMMHAWLTVKHHVNRVISNMEQQSLTDQFSRYIEKILFFIIWLFEPIKKQKYNQHNNLY